MSRRTKKEGPQPLKRVVGHDATWDRLIAALARDALHHALLVEGPRGVGKRTLADALALVANCEAVQGDYACGQCATCVAIRTGNHPDVVHLVPDEDRAARTIPIERVREMIRAAQYHRYGARRRFVIVDPAEAMQEPAANALLKTLEEPPPDTHFVLVTHNAKALLPTIRSRCQLIRLGAVPPQAMAALLAAEGHEVSADDAVVLSAMGCPGVALEAIAGGRADRVKLRDEVAAVLLAPLSDVYAFSAKLTTGARQDWSERVEGLLVVLEDAVRDAAVLATGAATHRFDPDDPIAPRLALTWPRGLTKAAAAIQEARDDLEVYVSGKLVLDALLTAIRRELRAT